MKQIGYQLARWMTKTNLLTWLGQSQKKLQGMSDFPIVETYAIASFVLSRPKEWLITHPNEELSSPSLLELESLLNRLVEGEPLPYLTGKQSFFGLEFEVTPDVLIPRPETELLVEEAINWLDLHPQRRSMLDVGTGSGIIPITLADRFENLTAHAVDISLSALVVANKNVLKYNLEEVIHLYPSDLLNGVSERFDLITANLPYIPTNRLTTLTVTRFEPRAALDGGQDGFNLIRKLLDQAPGHLLPGGLMLLEIDDSHAQLALQEAAIFFPFAKIAIINDLAHKPRLLRIQN